MRDKCEQDTQMITNAADALPQATPGSNRQSRELGQGPPRHGTVAQTEPSHVIADLAAVTSGSEGRESSGAGDGRVMPLAVILVVGPLILVAVAAWQLRLLLRARYRGVRADG